MNTQAIKWSELSTQECDRLIHTKVMGNPEHCDGKVVVTPASYSYSPMSSSYVVWVCDKCNMMGICDTEQEVPIQHAPKDTPNYSADMNAAMQIVAHERFSHSYINYVREGKLWSCALYSVDASGKRQIDKAYASSGSEAICIAALKACGVEVQQ